MPSITIGKIYHILQNTAQHQRDKIPYQMAGLHFHIKISIVYIKVFILTSTYSVDNDRRMVDMVAGVLTPTR